MERRQNRDLGYRISPRLFVARCPRARSQGRIRHDGGVVSAPGMYVMGLPFMRRRKSSFIDGAGEDAADLAAHLNLGLRRSAADGAVQMDTPRHFQPRYDAVIVGARGVRGLPRQCFSRGQG